MDLGQSTSGGYSPNMTAAEYESYVADEAMKALAKGDQLLLRTRVRNQVLTTSNTAVRGGKVYAFTHTKNGKPQFDYVPLESLYTWNEDTGESRPFAGSRDDLPYPLDHLKAHLSTDRGQEEARRRDEEQARRDSELEKGQDLFLKAANAPHELTASEYNLHGFKKPYTAADGEKAFTKAQIYKIVDSMPDGTKASYVAAGKGRYNLMVLYPHREVVAQALEAGKPVPAEVLADYPDLAVKYGKGNQ